MENIKRELTRSYEIEVVRPLLGEGQVARKLVEGLEKVLARIEIPSEARFPIKSQRQLSDSVDWGEMASALRIPKDSLYIIFEGKTYEEILEQYRTWRGEEYVASGNSPEPTIELFLGAKMQIWKYSGIGEKRIGQIAEYLRQSHTEFSE